MGISLTDSVDAKISLGKKTETYACKDGDNPIAAVIEAAMQDPKRKQFILDTGDPKMFIEKMKGSIMIRKYGPAGWIYLLAWPRFNLHLRIVTGTRLAEDLRYNPF